MNLNEQKKTALITYLILIAAIVLLFFAYIAIANIIGNSFDESTPEETEAEIAAEREFFPKLDEMYSAGDYEGLVGLIYSSEAEKINVRNYGHYDLAEFYRDYLKIKDYYIPMLDSGSISGIDAREMTSIVFSFYYRCYDNTMGVTGNSSRDDIKILDDIRGTYILEILSDRMGYTIDDMEACRNEIMKGNFFHSDAVYKYSDKYYERYR